VVARLGNVRQFGLRELQAATDGFSAKNILGKGGFGNVYRGRLPDGTTVAVKRLKDPSASGEAQFRTEVEMISLAVHRHLLRLVGFCADGGERLLVYPYMPNGSVASRLRGTYSSVTLSPLTLCSRIAVAIGTTVVVVAAWPASRFVHGDYIRGGSGTQAPPGRFPLRAPRAEVHAGVMEGCAALRTVPSSQAWSRPPVVLGAAAARGPWSAERGAETTGQTPHHHRTRDLSASLSRPAGDMPSLLAIPADCGGATAVRHAPTPPPRGATRSTSRKRICAYRVAGYQPLLG
jgi:hypothetical protein